MYEPNKSLGQNFLADSFIAQTMVQLLELSSECDVVEIGSGLGAVTEVLEAKINDTHSKLFAVEIDTRFTSRLSSLFDMNPKVEIINSDVLKFLPDFSSTRESLVIGSLPFYITSPIICAIIKMTKQPLRVVLLVQKEVAEKITAVVPDASFLSTFVQAFYTVEYIQEVPSSKFTPVPEVDGGIILLTKNSMSMTRQQIEKFEPFLRHGFKNPRKMINKTFSKDMLLESAVDSTLRPEAISVEKWVKLYTNANS